MKSTIRIKKINGKEYWYEDIPYYDKEKKQFTSRNKETTKPFPDLNREALAYVLDALEKKITIQKEHSILYHALELHRLY